jgi:hypothetical protein
LVFLSCFFFVAVLVVAAAITVRDKAC